MKSIITVGALLLAGIAGPVYADCGNNPSFLTQAQINTLLATRFACGRSTAVNAPGWNELHNGTRIVEQHNAGAADDEDIGAWSTATTATAIPGGSTGATRGRVTYSYTGGTAPTYEIATSANGNCGATCTTPGNFQFCGVGGGAPATLNILISAALPSLASCPVNP